MRNTCVDDFASGKDEVHEALRLQRSSTELMEQAAFNLTKWSSNSPELMQAIPEKDRASESLINLESDLSGVYISNDERFGFKVGNKFRQLYLHE